METTTKIPPQIIQHFNSKLLSHPTPKFNDDSETLWRIYTYINLKLIKKSLYNPRWAEKCEKLKQEFLELYEWTKAKEKNIETASKNKTKQPFYRIRILNRSHENIFDGFRYRSYRVASQSWETYEV